MMSGFFRVFRVFLLFFYIYKVLNIYMYVYYHLICLSRIRWCGYFLLAYNITQCWCCIAVIDDIQDFLVLFLIYMYIYLHCIICILKNLSIKGENNKVKERAYHCQGILTCTKSQEDKKEGTAEQRKSSRHFSAIYRNRYSFLGRNSNAYDLKLR